MRNIAVLLWHLSLIRFSPSGVLGTRGIALFNGVLFVSLGILHLKSVPKRIRQMDFIVTEVFTSWLDNQSRMQFTCPCWFLKFEWTEQISWDKRMLFCCRCHTKTIKFMTCFKIFVSVVIQRLQTPLYKNSFSYLMTKPSVLRNKPRNQFFNHFKRSF